MLCLLVLLFALPALAVEPAEVLQDRALETRAREIGRSLRCVVCQNQSIDDSSAAGDSDGDIFAFMVARYGDYVLLKPPFRAGTLVLWLGAPLLLLVAGGALLVAARRSRAQPVAAPKPLDEEERRRLDALLKD